MKDPSRVYSQGKRVVVDKARDLKMCVTYKASSVRSIFHWALCFTCSLVELMEDIPAVMEPDSNQHVHLASTVGDKKRQSGEYTASTPSSMDAMATTFTSATPSSSSTPQRSGSLKKMASSSKDESSSVSMSGSKSRHASHSRTQSIHFQPPKKKYSHVRRGSLPPLQINHNTNKLAHVDFGSPIRSPFATSIPPLPEKISIQIPHPKSDLSHIQVVKNKNIIENLSYIGLWYFFSTSLSLYNKNLMGKDRFNFNFPLLLSAIHAGLHALITSAMMSFGGSRWNTTKATLSLSDYIYKVVSNMLYLLYIKWLMILLLGTMWYCSCPGD